MSTPPPAPSRPPRVVPYTSEVPAGQWSANTAQLVMVPGKDYVDRTRTVIDRLRRLFGGADPAAPAAAPPPSPTSA
jgi:hypothetical protein